jgi:hypothetical protein
MEENGFRERFPRVASKEKVERVVPTRFDLYPRLAPKRMGILRSTGCSRGR